MKKTFGFGIAATMAISGAALADVVYDNPAGSGNAVNQEFGDFPTYSTYLVADVTIAAPGFTLTSISTPMTITPTWVGVTTARLHIFPKTGTLPVGGDDPTASQIVNVSYNANTGLFTTVGLSVDVPAGDYWIGLTGIGDFGVVGQAFQLGGINVNGEVDAYRNPGGAFAFPAGTNWGPTTDWATLVDIAMLIEGDPLAADCPWDLDANGSVGANDLLILFAQWGGAGSADFDGSGTVGTGDLLILLANWGPC